MTRPLRNFQGCANTPAEAMKSRRGLVGESEADVLCAVGFTPTRHGGSTDVLVQQTFGHGLSIDAEIRDAQQHRPSPAGYADRQALQFLYQRVAPSLKLG